MQIFHPSANTLSRLTIYGSAVLLLGPVVLTYLVLRSPYQTKVGVILPQPVPFSHEHHVRGLGIDCRYCHTSVETSSFAGIPPTQTCMTCHSQIWSTQPDLEPVRTSLAEKQPMAGPRVHDLPGLRVFQPRDPRQQGGRLCIVPRPDRSDADHVEGRAHDDGVVPQLPPRTRSTTCGSRRGLQHGMDAPRSESSSSGSELVKQNHIPKSTDYQLFGVPPMIPRPDQDPTTPDASRTAGRAADPLGAARSSGGAWTS